MELVHLACGVGRPVPMRLHHVCGGHDHYVIRVLAFEGTDGWTLVDAGFGEADASGPDRIGWLQRGALGFGLEPASLTRARLGALGVAPGDVRRIVLTHLDLDHAGGIRDFPNAEVHVSEGEWETAHGSWHPRYRRSQFAHVVPHLHRFEGGERWMGFEHVRALDASEQVLLVPLVGHSAGHMGVAVRDGARDRWILHAGDLYMHRGEVDPRAPSTPAYLRMFQRLIADNDVARQANLARVAALIAQDGPVQVVCAHDHTELPLCQ